MVVLLRIQRERTQLRRIFNRTADELEKKLKSADIDTIAANVDVKYLAEKIERIKVLDTQIQENHLEAENFNEAEYSAEVDTAEQPVKKFITLKESVECITPQSILKDDTLPVHEDRRNFKLPKLELKKFNDDPKTWIQFWGQFKKVHEDPTIDEEDKFQYLLQSLKEDSNARTLVESFPPSKKNYKKAVEQLVSRYGRKEVLVEVYIRELLGLVLAQARGELLLDIRSLYDKISTHLHALETLGVTKERYDAMLFPLIESAIPEPLLIAWSRSHVSGQHPQNSERLAKLLEFLGNEVEAEERIKLARSDFSPAQVSSIKSHCTAEIPTAACLTSKTTNEGKEACYFCDKTNHSVNECRKGADLSLEEKRELVKKRGNCFICLKKGHMAKKCKSFPKCLKCKRRHFFIMCPEIHGETTKKPNETVMLCQNNTTLLQTLVAVIVHDSKRKKVRLLLDSGSQRSYIKTIVAEELNLKVKETETIGHTLFGGVQKKPEVYRSFEFEVSALDNSYKTRVVALESNTLCGYLPKVQDVKVIQKLHNLNVHLTDQNSDIADISVLIGSDCISQILTGTLVHLENNLCAMKTKLGWTLQGPTTTTSSSVVRSCFIQSDNLSDLWDIEVIGIKDPQDNKREQDEILKIFNDNISETDDGRYQVQLLWKESIPELKSNYDQAYKRLETTTRKLKKTGNMQAYNETFQEWLIEGIIEEVTDDNKEEGHYLPHHPVIKLSSTTTRIRPVFDASAKDQNGWSLNDCLEKGINLIEFILKLLIIFRKGAYGITADIKKAFLNISLCERDRDSLKFLWWKNPNSCQEVVTYRHKRVVFGVTSSPFLLAATIKYHLERSPKNYKETAERLKDSFYVDNCITSVDDEAQMEKFISESKELMLKGKFDLRGWVTAPKRRDDTVTVPALGILWNTIQDDLQCSVNLKREVSNKITKRELLSVTQQIFDPLGLVCPVTLIPKIIMQKAWLNNSGWDQEIPKELQREFKDWLKTVHFINQCRIPRRLTCAPIEECRRISTASVA